MMKLLIFALLMSCVLMGCNRDEPGTKVSAEPRQETAPDQAIESTGLPLEAEQEPVPVPPGIALEGMFRYFADAPQFRDCGTGKVFPVAMAGPYIELERAYLNSGIEAGTELKVALHGRFLERPSMDENRNEVMLIVDSFDSVIDSGECRPTIDADLKNTYWKLVEIGGNPFIPLEGAKDTHVVLDTADSRVHGFAGCNNFFGQYESNDANLTFSSLGATMMACPDGMEAEQAFLQALGETDRAVVSGMFLQLYSSDRLVARLEAVYLP